MVGGGVSEVAVVDDVQPVDVESVGGVELDEGQGGGAGHRLLVGDELVDGTLSVGADGGH